METEMSKLFNIAGAAASALLLATVVAQAAGGGISTTPAGGGKIQLKMVAACRVAGTPSEFPDDIYIDNKGAGTIVKGTKINWSVPFANKSGNYPLAADLKAGKSVFLSGALGGGVEAGKECTAKVL
jgi:hypothetical protein